MAAIESSTDVRSQLSELVATLPDSELHAALRYLRFLEEEADPLLRRLREAPYDDEPFTPEEEEEARLAREEFARGEFVTLDELDARDKGD
jgi:hypothetical protein